jgi:cyclopropane-fatty-acyl-phospholipid synthase
MSTQTAVQRRGGGGVGRLVDEIAARTMLEAASRIRVGRLSLVLPDGTRRDFGEPGSADAGELRVHHPAAATRMLLGGEVGAGEAYMDGLWSSPDLPELLALAARNREALAMPDGWWRAPLRWRHALTHRARRNTRAGSRRNIEAHYDLGNDFYRLFLDETMTYSSAVFDRTGLSLADAQRRKYAVMAERAGIEGGERVLEIGTGWGGFALYAARELGCRVTTITISPAQHALATERVRSEGLTDRVSVELRDYRDPDREFRRHRLDRDARGGRRRVPRDVLRGVRPRAPARRAVQRAGHLLSRRGV